MNDALGQALLTLAKNAIAVHFGAAPLPMLDAPELALPGACFVTLTQTGRLRGCIGSLEAWRPLREDVRANAYSAAFRDPRFPPLANDELARIRIEVSLLSPAEPLLFDNEEQALRQLRPGVDGVVLEHGSQRSTFLPQVWENLPEPQQFISQLKIKAGLPPDFWDEGIRLFRYQVQKWPEENPS